MITKQAMRHRIGESAVFRRRGQDVSRIEAFSDAVFAFAITLLVVTLQPPQTYNDLLKVVDGLAAFALSFIMLAVVWYNHYTFFRRFGMEDRVTAVLNAVLLFVVLFYVYPLRFVFTLVVDTFTAPAAASRLIQADQAPGLYTMYGLGAIAVFLIFALLYAHAYRQRAALDLSVREAFETRSGIMVNLIIVGIGVLSVLLAQTGVGLDLGIPGWVYILITPAIMVFRNIRNWQWRARVAATGPGESNDHAPKPA